MKIFAKLIGGFALVAAVCAMVGGIGWYGIYHTRDGLNLVANNRLPAAEGLGLMMEGLNGLKSAERTMMISSLTAADRAHEVKNLGKRMKVLDDGFALYDAIEAGVDVVTFSADKLLGGPQGGVILGKKDLIERLKNNPVARALRVDKLSLASLASLLTLYRDEMVAVKEIPVLAMLFADERELKRRARRIVRKVRGNLHALKVESVREFAECGGGALPGMKLPSWCVAVAGRGDPMKISEVMRSLSPPVVGRVKDDRFLIDVRTVFSEEDVLVAEKILELDRRMVE